MSLNWNAQNCEGGKAVLSEKEWPITDSLIWTTMAVGLGSLTAKNEKEWKVRIAMWAETERGKSSFDDLLALPPLAWKARHGLRCNVSDTTRAAFRRRLAMHIEREAEARVRNMKED